MTIYFNKVGLKLFFSVFEIPKNYFTNFAEQTLFTFHAKAMGKTLYNKINKEELRVQLEAEPFKRTTLSFYKYAHILNPKFFRDHLFIQLDQLKVFGRIYIASEGINGQISIPEHKLSNLKHALDQIDFLKDVRLNIAIEDDGISFIKLKIKLRNKIVADGLDDESFDVTDRGTHISAEKFNELTERDDTIVVDMRNHYESEVGHFKNAIVPDVETFRESLPIVENLLDGKEETPIIMYCTGGIRCEKASAYYKHKGYKNIYQLDGGIIEYAREVNMKGLENKFIGKNFVFDDRLGERISEEVIAHCHQCGEKNDNHVNCANDACHILFIQCESCGEKNEGCCSQKCREYIQLPEEEQIKRRVTEVFNGTKFGKGRYKAHRKDHNLEQ